ncbi:MAG: hypothetical protein NT027_13670 [Proteobacteria bacterium]|nr:hypothetical protein [Pseudomonadota bacterium]
MKTFLAVFTGSESSENHKKWNLLSQAEQKTRIQQGMQAWQNWAMKNQTKIVQVGGPLSKTTLIDKEGIHDYKNNLSAFTIVKADSKASAAELFIEHPHFMIFPGDAVELMEILPIPN